MSTSPPFAQVGPQRWARPTAWPVWVLPALLAVVQVMGSVGAERGGGPGQGHWEDPGGSARPAHDYGFTALDPLAFALLLGGPALLLLRRRHPRFTLVAAGALTALYFLRAYPYGPAPFAALLALMSAVNSGHRLFVWTCTSAGLGAYFALTWVIGVPWEQRGRAGGPFPVDGPTVGGASFVIGWALVGLVTAELVRMRRQKAEASARTRAEEDRRQASEERLRMARELHDVLAHNISMINVQAGVALHLIDDDPGQARTALAAIKEASREALGEMRSVIGALRAQGESAPRSPTAGLDRLEDLLARARTAGLRVDAEITGDRRPLHAGTDLAAFRIVQESLTNVTRHAGSGPVTARVLVAYGADEITVRIEDDGRGVALLDDRPGGSGIRGMRERAAALGGTFEAGPRQGGGFRVTAALPLAEEAAPDPAGLAGAGPAGSGSGSDSVGPAADGPAPRRGGAE